VPRQVKLAPDHQLGDVFLGGLCGFQRAAVLTVTQNGNPIGDLEDLFHPVRDVDDADAMGFEVLDHLEQDSFLGIGKRRRRLIEDHGLGFMGQRPRDLHHLLVGN
jgi:hypothetical protein